MFNDAIPRFGPNAIPYPRPTDVSRLFPDPNKSLDVLLVIENAHLVPEDRTWSLVWRVQNDSPEYRLIQVVKEGFYGHESSWMKWGARTTAYHSRVQSAVTVAVGKYSLEQRQKWENLANDITVRDDCNASLLFVKDILDAAVGAGLLTHNSATSLVNKLGA